MTPIDHRIEHIDGVAVITLDRPAAYNALTAALLDSLHHTLHTLANDDAVRALVLTGSGKAFCSGQALDDPQSLPPGDAAPDLGRVVRDHYAPLLLQLISYEKPIVAAINGVTAGAGLGLALACDFRIVSERATFTTAFVNIGLVPDSGVTVLLPHLIGYARALELSMLGDRFDAAAAHAYGLVTALAAPDTVLADALAFATRLARGPKSLAYIKRAFVANNLGDIAAALEREATLQSAAGATDDFREGLAAFKEKRDPHFTGR